MFLNYTIRLYGLCNNYPKKARNVSAQTEDYIIITLMPSRVRRLSNQIPENSNRIKSKQVGREGERSGDGDGEAPAVPAV